MTESNRATAAQPEMTPDEKRCATCWGECGKCVLERDKPKIEAAPVQPHSGNPASTGQTFEPRIDGDKQGAQGDNA